MFETQKSGNKTSSGEIGLDITTHARPKVGQDQVSGRVSVLCWNVAPVANVANTVDIYQYVGGLKVLELIAYLLSSTDLDPQKFKRAIRSP